MTKSNQDSKNRVKCPTCRVDVLWEEKSVYRPFCSKKCQLIDFGDWASEQNNIAGAADLSDGEEWSEK
ncbi:DNA gyrase inhibitor YacG [Vibrio sp. SS-MA-C1-2]|uniref:DNA gyrase inhibitor YacG n=1 Tax=Vibrio sp. SS-MA-C1-2 TaxID=2908646 RepID=UPI001F253C2D|nr:DNA gyrase inhibitor YacG [Vibrio sp. SS-MA-C1-2]UJF19618.1 DNA gyrase inhibitor YacG [Vibrio sp. SS-MA-C1-2]